MIFLAEVTSVSYLDSAPEFNKSYDSEDVLDFTNYVEATRSHIKGMMRFDSSYADIHEIRMRLVIHGQHVATETFRRSIHSPCVITQTRITHI